MAGPVSVKHIEIDKARSNAIVIIAAATVVVVFCLMSTKALLGQAAYQRKVINARHAGLQQLKSNVTAANQLVAQYNQVFEGNNPSNVIGGQNTKSSTAAPPNGDNASIVLDALPSKYDYPALLSSVNYILTRNGASGVTIAGTDDTATAKNDPSPQPQPQPIMLTITGNDSYASILNIIQDFENSIRPFSITNLQINGADNSNSFSISLTTYYQPAKSLDLTTKEIK